MGVSLFSDIGMTTVMGILKHTNPPPAGEKKKVTGTSLVVILVSTKKVRVYWFWFWLWLEGVFLSNLIFAIITHTLSYIYNLFTLLLLAFNLSLFVCSTEHD